MADRPKNQTAENAPADPWRSGRARFDFRQLRRGRDHKWFFSGQQPGEDVRLIVRKHWWFLVRPALPFLGSALLFFILLSASTLVSINPIIWYIVDGIDFLLVLATGIWFAYKDLVVWWFDTFIITNKRIVSSRGLLEPTRQQTPIERVTQVGIGVETTLGFLLNFGTVHVYLSGGDLQMRDVPNPRRVRDAIQGITDVLKTAKKPDEPRPFPKMKGWPLFWSNLPKVSLFLLCLMPMQICQPLAARQVSVAHVAPLAASCMSLAMFATSPVNTRSNIYNARSMSCCAI